MMWRFLASLLVVGFTSCFGVAIADDAIRAELREIAGTLKVLPADLLACRAESFAAHSIEEPQRTILRRFIAVSKRGEHAFWWETAKDDDAKIRSLAIAALAWRGDVKTMDRLVPFCDDNRPSFPNLDYPQQQAAARPGAALDRGTRPQTVGDFAKFFVNRHLQAAGYYHGVKGGALAPSFADYWAARGELVDCYSWIHVALQDANAESSELPRELQQAVFDRLRKRIDALPMPERGWTMLALATPVQTGGYHDQANRVVSHNDLIAAAKAIGRPALLDLIDGRIQTRDPDHSVTRTDHSNSVFPIKRIQDWVLHHGDVLLDPSDVPRLLAHKPDHHFADRLIAAAHLVPANADSYLQTAFRSFQGRRANAIQADRGRVCLGMWELSPDKYRELILNWFYQAPLHVNDDQFGRSQFARSLGDAKYNGLLLAICNDQRFSTLQWAPMYQIVSSANRIHPGVIDNQDTFKARPVFGGQQQGKGAVTHFKRDQAAVERIVNAWRKQITDAIKAG